jgi:helicase-exonuclease AddAB, AddB subunit
MSLQIILGGSGSGKTYFMYKNLIREAINEPDNSYIALVPEQFTIEIQKQMIKMHPNKGLMNIDILSFGRLAYKVFDEMSAVSLTVLDDMGKSMILRQVAMKNEQDFGYFKSHLGKMGFISQLKSILSEFYQYNISELDMEEIIAKSNTAGILKEKLRDISYIYKAFKAELEGKYITAEEILEVLCKYISKSKLIASSEFVIDGYTGFTPIQYKVLRLLIKYAKKVTVAISVRLEEFQDKTMSEYEFFNLSKSTYNKLELLAVEEDVVKETDIFIYKGVKYTDIRSDFRNINGQVSKEYRFAGSPELLFLEENFGKYNVNPYKKDVDNISIYAVKNPTQEAVYVSEEIFKLVKNGMRYRDIAIITSALSEYENIFIKQFDLTEMPYFIDNKRSIIGNPAVELIRSALEIVKNSFSYESVFRYLKTGISTIKLEEVDILENYVIAMGIRGKKRWNEEWLKIPYRNKTLNMDIINDIRSRFIEEIMPFYTICKDNNSSVKDKTIAVVLLLEAVLAKEQLNYFAEKFNLSKEFSLAKEYEQSYALIMELFDRIVSLMGDDIITVKDYGEILDSGFEEIKVGVVPSYVDQIIIGDIERTRLSDIKVLFFVGVNDIFIPKTANIQGVFTENEKSRLEKEGIELSPGNKKGIFIQKFYQYLLLTKPSEKLYISFTKSMNDGSAGHMAYLVNDLRNMYTKLSVKNYEVSKNGNYMLNGVVSEKTAFSVLIDLFENLRKIGIDKDYKDSFNLDEQSTGINTDNNISKMNLLSYVSALYIYFLSNDKYKARLYKLENAMFYKNCDNGISAAVAKVLYGQTPTGSVTRLEKYAACAYAHFLSYGLELSERAEYEFASLDIGNIFHESIDLVFKEFKNRNYDWNTIDDTKRAVLVSECVNKVMEDYNNKILKSSSRNEYIARKLEIITNRTIWALYEQIKRGDFEPRGFEIGFSVADAMEASAIMISEDERMNLRGRIDRLDIYEEEEAVYVKVIDYKSGNTEFDLTLLYYGIQLQLAVYMEAAIEITQKSYTDKKIIPAGIFYYNIDNPLVDRNAEMTKEKIDEKLLESLRMNGLVNSDEDILTHLDNTFENRSLVIPVSKSSKTGEIMKSRSSVANNEQFDALRLFVKDKLKDMGKDMYYGNIAVKPYKSGNKTACDYCKFHSICGFDTKFSGFEFNRVKKFKDEEIWDKIVNAKSKEVGSSGSKMD